MGEPMKRRTLPLAIAAALSTAACAATSISGVDDLILETSDRTVASVSQDAGLSLAAGVAPGTEGGFFYDWPRRNYEQQIQSAQLRELALERQARALP